MDYALSPISSVIIFKTALPFSFLKMSSLYLLWVYNVFGTIICIYYYMQQPYKIATIPIQLMGEPKLRRLSNLAKSQSQYLVELGYELRPFLGLETANIHNFLCLPEVPEGGCGW